MAAELSLDLPRVFGFLLVLARVSGVIIFVPLPGMQSVPEASRVVLALAISFVLMPAWPMANPVDAGLGRLPGWIAAEFTFGLLVGVCVSFLLEGFQMAAQMVGLQAGYSFASTVDPNTQADSAILQILTQLLASLLFLSLGYDRAVIRVLATSLERIPTVSSLATSSVIDAVVRLGSQIFIIGFNLAMPVVALLILIDLSFSIVGKVHSQFQLMSLLFPAKMLVGIAMLAASLAAFSKVAQLAGNHTIEALTGLIGK